MRRYDSNRCFCQGGNVCAFQLGLIHSISQLASAGMLARFFGGTKRERTGPKGRSGERDAEYHMISHGNLW